MFGENAFREKSAFQHATSEDSRIAGVAGHHSFSLFFFGGEPRGAKVDHKSGSRGETDAVQEKMQTFAPPPQANEDTNPNMNTETPQESATPEDSGPKIEEID